MQTTPRRPRLIRATQALFFLNALIWLLFGVTGLVRTPGGSAAGPTARLVIAVLMLGNAGAMLLSGLGIGSGRRRYYYFALAVLAVNILLTVTDQFGLLDFLTLVIDLTLLGILVVSRPAPGRGEAGREGGEARPWT